MEAANQTASLPPLRRGEINNVAPRLCHSGTFVSIRARSFFTQVVTIANRDLQHLLLRLAPLILTEIAKAYRQLKLHFKATPLLPLFGQHGVNTQSHFKLPSSLRFAV